jgi:hypothetical protein
MPKNKPLLILEDKIFTYQKYTYVESKIEKKHKTYFSCKKWNIFVISK